MLKFNKLLLPTMATLAISTSAFTNPVVSLNTQPTKYNPLAPGIIIKYKNYVIICRYQENLDWINNIVNSKYIDKIIIFFAL